MAIDMLRVVTAHLSTCSRRVSSAARKLQLYGAHKLNQLTSSRPSFSCRIPHVIPFLGNRRRKDELIEGEEIWRRGIIMGDKCQPLDFSGAIYYDSDGRQLAGVSIPRSPMRSFP